MNGDSGAQDCAPLEALTLAHLCGRLLRRPLRTLRDLRQIIRKPVSDAAPLVKKPEQNLPQYGTSQSWSLPSVAASSLGFRLLALALALWGTHKLVARPENLENGMLARGALFLLPALALWLLADGLYAWPRHLTHERSLPRVAPQVAVSGRRKHRLLAALAGALCCVLAWRFTAHNHITSIGLGAWLASMMLWLHALTPGAVDLRACWRGLLARLKRVHWRRRETLALALILLLAAGLRLSQLDTVMPGNDQRPCRENPGRMACQPGRV